MKGPQSGQLRRKYAGDYKLRQLGLGLDQGPVLVLPDQGIYQDDKPSHQHDQGHFGWPCCKKLLLGSCFSKIPVDGRLRQPVFGHQLPNEDTLGSLLMQL